MANFGSFLDLRTFSRAQFEGIFSRSEKLRRSPEASVSSTFQGERLALLFFEPSTRTRMSFESAAYRCGLGPLVFDGGPNTSLEKGETAEDSILNIAAMEPRALVIRCGDSVPLARIASELEIPVINAGWGVQGHPTQALLDAVTMKRAFPELEGKKVLILGDVRHSRVAASHFELLPTLGVKVAVCGPEEFLVSKPGVEVFKSLKQALQWADVAMTLRVQFERHIDANKLSSEDYRKHFGLNAESLRYFSPAGIIMHPGPINRGIEMESDVLNDSRCKVLEQVRTGVFVREALIRQIFEGVV
jgi:aspartate carbamoyltransferase catalytic subunit